MNFKERPFEITIVALILLSLIVFFGLKPILRNLHSINLEVGVKKEELSKKKAKLDSLNSMKAKLDALKEDLSLMQKALPKEEDMPGLLVQVEALVSQSGLSLSSFAPSAEQATAGGEQSQPAQTAPSGIAQTAFALSLSGTYPSFLTFLENVEKNLRPTSVSSVNVQGGGSDKPISVNLNMVSFYQK